MRQLRELLQSISFQGHWKGLANDNIISRIESDLDDVYYNKVVKEGFPLLREWGIYDAINEGLSTSSSCRQGGVSCSSNLITTFSLILIDLVLVRWNLMHKDNIFVSLLLISLIFSLYPPLQPNILVPWMMTTRLMYSCN